MWPCIYDGAFDLDAHSTYYTLDGAMESMDSHQSRR